MRTAVQLRNDQQFFSYTMHGHSEKTTKGMKGDIVLYEDGEIVAYIIGKAYNKRAFIFETDSIQGTHKIPGVYPAVRLLVETRSRGKTQRLQKYLRYALNQKISLYNLPDAFYCRLNILLEERSSHTSDFYHLLRRWAK